MDGEGVEGMENKRVRGERSWGEQGKVNMGSTKMGGEEREERKEG